MFRHRPTSRLFLKPRLRLLAFLGVWLSWVGTGIAYVDGPPPGVTGGFGGGTCHKCHFENDLNDASGSFNLDGIPENYIPGEQYLIELILARSELGRGGFQLAVRFSEGPRRGLQAGLLEAVGDRVEIIIGEEHHVQYAQQTDHGSIAEPDGSARWAVHWIAPTNLVGPVAFNAAANASNDDQSEFGDFIYAQETFSRPRLIRHRGAGNDQCLSCITWSNIS